MKRFFSFLIFGLFLVACSPEVIVSNFEECVAETGIVMESYPRQCAYEGETFVEVLEESVALDDQFAEMKPFLSGAVEAALGVEDGVSVELKDVRDDHVAGLYRLGDGPDKRFLAAWQFGEWEAVYTGGDFRCTDLAGYDFPQDMLEGCT